MPLDRERRERRSPGSPPSSAPRSSRRRAGSSGRQRQHGRRHPRRLGARGLDPRGSRWWPSAAPGRCTPAALARELGIRASLIPPAPGHPLRARAAGRAAALDLVRTPRGAPRRHDRRATGAADSTSSRSEASAWLDRERVPASGGGSSAGLDLRYVGQNFELMVPAARRRGRLGCEALHAEFLREHERVYGYAAADEPVQVVALRLAASGPRVPPMLARCRRGDRRSQEARIGERAVYDEEAGRFLTSPSTTAPGSSPAIASPAPPSSSRSTRRPSSSPARRLWSTTRLPRHPGGRA